ncbi:FAD-dependent oxidoreductase, partial [Candidatus Woesearchaeota archaeon]|nr:FAD-dependent oxidoreductase [Candidatus Woesearchaeota archaeon]
MKQVIIIGGGFCGTHAAQQLENDFSTTLIDNKDYFEFTPGILRTIVEPEHGNKIQAFHKNYLKKTNILLGQATTVTKNEVLVRKKKIHFDYLIIASGSTYNLPIKAENIVLSTRAKVLQEYHEKLDNATNILIIGGGIVGVELAAEIVTYYNNKNVVIVHAKNQLIERQPEKARIYAEKFLTKNNVEIHFNELVMEQKNKTYYTDKGNMFTPDLTFLCTGIVPNTEFMKKDLLN